MRDDATNFARRFGANDDDDSDAVQRLPLAAGWAKEKEGKPRKTRRGYGCARSRRRRPRANPRHPTTKRPGTALSVRCCARRGAGRGGRENDGPRNAPPPPPPPPAARECGGYAAVSLAHAVTHVGRRKRGRAPFKNGSWKRNLIIRRLSSHTALTFLLSFIVVRPRLSDIVFFFFKCIPPQRILDVLKAPL